MSGSFSAVNLAQLAPPPVIEQLDFETILASMVADLQARAPEFSALLESDPAYKILEVCAYRELNVRARVNDGAKALFLAFAQGADLDHIGANISVARLVVTPAQPNAVPPVPAVMESDDAFRSRIQIAFQGFSVAGPEGAYIFHALSADGRVKDVSAISPAPGVVSVYVLSHEEGGTPSDEVLAKVSAVLNDSEVRPLTDQVSVYAASIVPYTVQAKLTLFHGPDATVVLEAARQAVRDYTTAINKLGYEVALSGLYRALHQAGVQQADITLPASNILLSPGQAALCTHIDVTLA